MSFTTYRFFVFKSQGDWFPEYLRAFCVYGLSGLLGTFSLVILVDVFGAKFWLAQGVVIFFTVLISYVGHKKFTFKKS
jgi:putative flippase GtrA